MIVIFVSDTCQKEDSLPADTDFKRGEEDHVKKAGVTRLSPQRAARQASQRFAHSISCA